jgi:hypothetical protein
LELTSPTSGGLSIDTVLSRTQTTEIVFVVVGLKRGQLSFVSAAEELLEKKRKVVAPV